MAPAFFIGVQYLFIKNCSRRTLCPGAQMRFVFSCVEQGRRSESMIFDIVTLKFHGGMPLKTNNEGFARLLTDQHV
jgi:hypothetical protein